MEMDSFSIRNFGCRVNQAEAFDWAADLQGRGLRLEPECERGGLVIVNTCTLTQRADRDARKFIRRVARLNPGARIVVTGCLAERDPEGLGNIDGVWRVLSNREKGSLAESLCLPAAAPADTETRAYRCRALLKVQDGCDMSCAFCIIPSVRGESRSVCLTDALERFDRLVRLGYQEIVLTGIHLCSYGRDLKPKSSLLELLERLEIHPAEVKIRLSSLDPRLLPRPLLRRLASSPKICPHFHLSLQHGSDGILKAMGRASTASEYGEILAFLKGVSPEAALGADIIVGFPGETDRDFADMEDFLSRSPLTYFHVFSYSPRPGTPASGDRPVDPRTTKERAACLRRISKQKNLLSRESMFGRRLEGVVIRRGPGGGARVLTANYIDVCVPACPASEGEAVAVRIDRVTAKETRGEICP